MSQNLAQQLRSWDGIHSEFLRSIYEANAHSSTFFDQLIELCLEHVDLQVTTTWLIKNHYDQKQHLSEAALLRLLSGVDRLEHWGAQLHVLQILPMSGISEAAVPLLMPFVRNSFQSTTKFVRAAAYPAFYEITILQPQLIAELKALCDEAMEKESASIKFKVRKVLKKLS